MECMLEVLSSVLSSENSANRGLQFLSVLT